MKTLLLALHFILGDTTTHPAPIAIHPKKPLFDWTTVETNVSPKFRDSVIEVMQTLYTVDEHLPEEYVRTEEFAKSFHFVDVNADRLPDVVYEGHSGAESYMVNIFLNRAWRLEKIYKSLSVVAGWQSRNGRLQSLALFYWGCCADIVNIEQHLEVTEKWEFLPVRQRAFLYEMFDHSNPKSIPDEYFDKPISFKTTSEYSLRFSPEILSEPPSILGDWPNGNVIAWCAKGATGTAWASRKDETGRVWWLVEMNPTGVRSDIYYYHNDQPTHYYGWMSSRFLQETNP